MGHNGVISKKILIDIDFTEGFLLSRPAGQIVLGNPLIADIKVQDDRQLFLIGKSPGRTNMLIYGRDGQLQERHILMVRDPNTYLTYYKGLQSVSIMIVYQIVSVFFVLKMKVQDMAVKWIRS